MTAPASPLKSISVSDPILAELMDQLANRLQAGEPVDVEEVLRAHPERAEELRRLLPAVEILAALERWGISDQGSGVRDQGSDDSKYPGLTRDPRPMARGSDPSPLTHPSLLGDFRIIREIGRGGMGVVYEAEQISLGRRIALKVLPFASTLDPRQLQRFRNEAHAAAQLHHTNIVPVFATGCERSVHFYAMQFIEGQTLAHVVHELTKAKETTHRATESTEKGLNTATSSLCSLCLYGSKDFFKMIAHLGIQAAEALEYAHQMGIIHRDIKPANLLLQQTPSPLGREGRGEGALTALSARRSPLSTRFGGRGDGGEGGQLRLWITDFGLARLTNLASHEGGNLTMTGDLIGTLRYMSPEQALGKQTTVDHRSDIYSLGLTLYEMLTLEPAFHETDRAKLLHQIAFQDPCRPRALNPSIPTELETIVLKAVEKTPSDRYGTAQELANDLRRFLEDKPILARPVGRLTRTWRWCRRNPALTRVGMAAVAALLLGTITSTIFAVRAYRAADLAEQRTQLANTRLAEQYLDLALAVCTDEKDPDPGRGLHWLIFALEACPKGQADLERVIRLNLTGWQSRVPRLQTILTTPGSIRAAVMSPDGHYFATGGQDNAVQLWDVTAREPLGPSLSHPGKVLAVAFSPDGKKLLTGCEDRVARLWDVAAGRLMAPLFRHGAPIHTVAFSPDAKAILTGGDDKTVCFWDAETGNPIGERLKHQAIVLAVAFSPDGKALLTAGQEDIVRLWNLKTKQSNILQSESSVNALALSPDGRAILTGMDDHSAQFWDVDKLKRIGLTMHHKGAVACVAISSDGRTALTGSADTTARFWEAPTGRPLPAPLHHAGGVNGLGLTPDGRTLWTASGDVAGAFGEIRVWQADPQASIRFSPLEHALIKSVAFSPDGQRIVTGNGSGDVQIWVAGAEARAERVNAPVTGAMTDLAGNPGHSLPTHHSPLTLLQTWKHRTVLDAVAFHPNGRMILTAGLGGTAQLWDAVTGQPIGKPIHHGSRIRSAVFSPDGRVILTAGGHRDASEPSFSSALPSSLGIEGKGEGGANDFGAKLWSTETQELIGLPLEHPHPFVAVAFSPDGTKIATSRAKDYVTQIWDLTSWRAGSDMTPVGPPITGHLGWVWAMTFSPDGKKLLTGSIDYKAQQWDAVTSQPVGAPMDHPDRVWGVAYSPDGKIILTGCKRGMAQLWDADTGKRLGPPIRHAGPVASVAFHPDGQSFLTGSSENSVQIWPVPQPMPGSADHLRLWAQVITGMEMDTQGNISVLSAAEWQARPQRMEKVAER
jgi:WD40 repeat protein/serine/threonine protein kinase